MDHKATVTVPLVRRLIHTQKISLSYKLLPAMTICSGEFPKASSAHPWWDGRAC